MKKKLSLLLLLAICAFIVLMVVNAFTAKATLIPVHIAQPPPYHIQVLTRVKRNQHTTPHCLVHIGVFSAQCDEE